MSNNTLIKEKMFETWDKGARVSIQVKTSVEFPTYESDKIPYMEVQVPQGIEFAPLEQKRVPLGIKCDIKEGYYIQVSMNPKAVFNSPIRMSCGIEIITSENTNELAVILVNFSGEKYTTIKASYLIFTVHKVLQANIIQNKKEEANEGQG